MLKALSFISLCLLTAFHAQAIDVVDYPLYLGSAQSLKAVILPLKNDDTKALVQVSGVNHTVDRVVFLAELQNRGQGFVAYRNDSLLKEVSIGAYCSQVAGEMARIGHTHSSRQTSRYCRQCNVRLARF